MPKFLNKPTDSEGNVLSTEKYVNESINTVNTNTENTYAKKDDIPTNYAGSSTAGGSATSAVKLDSSAGSATQPVYFSNGKPVKTTYTLGKSVPSNAVFTDTVYTHPSYTAQDSGLYKVTVDSTGHVSSVEEVVKSDITALGIPASDTNTHYTSKNVVNSSNTATSNTTTALTNGNVYLISVENGAVTSAHKITGSGATTVTTDTSGNIIINSTDTNTTYTSLKNPYSLTIQGNGTTLTNGTYDGSAAKTVNITPSSIGAAASSHTHSYLPLSGGTLSSSNYGPLTIERSGSTNDAGIYFKNSNGILGSIAMSSTGVDGLIRFTADSTQYYDILDTGNAFTTTTPKANGTAAAGSATTVSRSDHVHPLQTSVSGSSGSCTGNAATATTWATARNINGLSVNGSANRVNYGTCSTAAATQAKIVDCTGFALVTGAEITVKFTVTNTASNPTLNVNGTGNKAIKYRGSNITAGYLADNRTYTFRYDGTNYDLVGDINTDTNTDTKVTQSGTTTANYRPILMGFNYSTDVSTLTTTVTDQVMTSSSIYAQPSTGTLYASKYNGYKVEGTSGNWFSSFPVIRNDGVMEAGKHIDFHTTNTGTTDYDVRLTAGSDTLTCSGSITATAFSGNASSATKWDTARNINGLSVDGSANRVNYGTCSTAAATAAKVVACTGFALVTGAEITVKFTVTNTAASPTLNVNSTGAKAIYYRGSAISAGYLAANRTYTFRYNGTQYDLVGDLDTNTVYTHPTTSGNKHIPSGGSSGQILRWSGDGTAAWGADNNTDTKVTSAAVNPSSATTYYPTLVTGATTGTVSYNTDLNAGILQGTTSTEGYAILKLGNSTAKGTAGNKRGQINLYSPSTACSYIRQADITSAITHYLPATGGTVLNSGTTSFTPSITSGSKSGVLKINDNSYDIYFTDTKVTQTNTTTSAAYRLLMSGNANDTTQTVTTCKSTKFTANPSTGCLTASMFKGAYSTIYSGTIAASSGTITISNLWNYSILFVTITNINVTLAQVDRYPIAVQKLYANTSNMEIIHFFENDGSYSTSTSKFLRFRKSSTANSIDITTEGITKIGMIEIEAFL